ncbi:MAG TPA: bifunctional DNA-formamidopyrimidine glycosylase/DNA-(apurinic or apyrimidinic site) lyase [Elusimicrobiota bacterium]|nr:bifunctional DNA-formamidopyrimidine glycosylase/DNA-(apurinic or apyrimidinic site) lyase [Elusimicrobiota bacterium]
MPELPEVETIRSDLDRHLRGKMIADFDVCDRRLLSIPQEARWKSIVPGRSIAGFRRRGKYLIADLSGGWRIIWHLRMTGQLVMGTPAPEARYRLRIQFDDAPALCFYDQRRFGEVWLLAADQGWPSRAPLGPDAVDELARDYFVRLVKQRTTRIQALLLDQRLIAGVGNIYAQEALFKASIRPNRPARRVTVQEANRLYDALSETLQTAIARRGSTSRNYRDAYGQAGMAQLIHQVYRKGGLPCPRCGTTLRQTRVGGRGTVFCPDCQR